MNINQYNHNGSNHISFQFEKSDAPTPVKLFKNKEDINSYLTKLIDEVSKLRSEARKQNTSSAVQWFLGILIGIALFIAGHYWQ